MQCLNKTSVLLFLTVLGGCQYLGGSSPQSFAEKLIVLEGAGHGFRGEHGSQAAAALADWFERYLVKQDTD